MGRWGEVLECQRLVDIYYELIGWEHHKTRDTIFSIDLEFRAGKEPTFFVNHCGYVSEFSEETGKPISAFKEQMINIIRDAVDLECVPKEDVEMYGCFGLDELQKAVPHWKELVKEAEDIVHGTKE